MSTNIYTRELPDYGSLMPIQEFKECCESGGFIDYDGYGYPVKDNMMGGYDTKVWPSDRDLIPIDATHIMWFNR